MKQIDLTQYGLTRPEKVRWQFPYTGGELLDYVRSKGLKKVLKKADDLLKENSITLEYKKVSKQEYLEWLPIYTKRVLEKGFDVLATPEWYDIRIEQGKEIWGFFFYQDNRIVGSSIITKLGKEKAISAFKVSEDIRLSHKHYTSMGSMIDYKFLTTMIAEDMQEIRAGRSRNAFGVVNTLGYLDYKMRFGYEPVADPNAEFFTSVPLNQEGYVLTFCLDKHDRLGLYAFVPPGYPHTFEQERFARTDLPFIYIEYVL